MATAYLRPSADNSIKHSLNTGSTAYSLLNEVTCDGDATYIYQSLNGTETSANLTSTITTSGTIPGGFDSAVVNSATLHVFHARTVSTEGTASNTKFNGSVTVDNTSASWEKTGSNTDYLHTTASLPITGYNFGTVTNKSTSIYTKIDNTQTKSTTSTCRISQIYIQVEYTGYWAVESSLVMGCGCTLPGTQSFADGTSGTLTFTLDSGKKICKLLDNGVDVTSLVTQSGTTATYNISTVSKHHVLKVYTEVPSLKLGGAWRDVRHVWKKVNSSWVEQTDLHVLFDTQKAYRHTGAYFWDDGKCLPKSSGLTYNSTWSTTKFIEIQPNTAITLQMAADPAGVGFNTYNSDQSYYDWWGAGTEGAVITIEGVTIYTRTLAAASVGNCYWIKANVPTAGKAYCKVTQNDVTLFDGAAYKITD